MYVGIIHLGGEYTLNSTFNSSTKRSMEEIKSWVAMKGNFACRYGIAASMSNEETASNGTHKHDESSAIQLHSDIKGGPQHVSSVEAWKNGLVSDSRTWAVIECESSNRNDYITVYELVQNCTESLEDANRLGNTLKKAMEPEITTGLTTPDFYYINCVKSEIVKLKTNQETIYCDDLAILVEQMWQCDTDWIKLFQEDGSIAEILIKGPHQTLVESEKSLVRLRLKRLIEPLSIRVFPEKVRIVDWLHTNKVTIEKESTEYAAAVLVYNVIKQAINAAVKTTLLDTVQNEIGVSLPKSKQKLITEVLRELVESKKFDSYKTYIKDPTKWIQRRTYKQLFGQNKVSSIHCRKLVYSFVYRLVSNAENNILAATKYCTGEAEKGITDWIQFLVECVKPDLAIPTVSVQNIQNAGDINIPRFHNIVVENMFDLVDVSIKETEATVLEAIMKKVWGCPLNCPFCGESCRLGVEHVPHKAHSCFEHRPLCITGTVLSKKKDKKELFVKNCSEMSKSSESFNCSSCWRMCRQSGKCRVKEDIGTSVDIKGPLNTDISGEDKAEAAENNLEYWHEFKKYKIYLPHWNLEVATSSGTSDYWKWFVYTYREELQKEYGIQLSDIPKSWGSITKQKAFDSLSAK